jgi:hypothetical protein
MLKRLRVGGLIFGLRHARESVLVFWCDLKGGMTNLLFQARENRYLRGRDLIEGRRLMTKWIDLE